MGRFYQTSDAKFVDNKMFEAPHQLMAQVLQNKDKEIDTEITSATAYLDKLKADVLTQDSPELQQEIKNYEAKITGIVDNIKSNPLEYNKYSSDIMHLGRDINANWTTGKIGQMQQNKKDYDKRVEYLDDYLKKNPEESAYVEAKRKAILADYQKGIQFNDNTGKASNRIDKDSELYKLDTNEDFLKDLKAKGIEYKKTSNGHDGYIYESNGQSKILTEDEIADKYIDYIKANPHITNALNDWKNVGVQGFNDVDVNNAKQLKVDANGKAILDKHGNQQFDLNPNNYIGAKAIAAGRFRQDDRSTGNNIESDSTYQWSVNRADAQKASMEALGATTEQIKLEGKEWEEANTVFLKGIADFSKKYNLPKDYNTATSMTSMKNYTNSIAKIYGKNSVKYKEALLDLQKVYNSQQTTADKGFGVLIPKYGVEITKQIMITAQNLNKQPETVNLMAGTAQKYNPSTDRFEPIYSEKNISLLELKAHPEKYGLKASDFNVQVNNEPNYNDDGTEKKKGLEEMNKEKNFTGTEKYGKHTPNYYVPNSLQPHYVPNGKNNPKGYYTYDLDINGNYFRMTMPMEKFNIVTGQNINK
jgi:hypothetical protein